MVRVLFSTGAILVAASGCADPPESGGVTSSAASVSAPASSTASPQTPSGQKLPALRLVASDSFSFGAFAPGGRWLATAGNPATIWDGSTNLPVASLIGDSKRTRDIHFSPDGSRVAFVGSTELRVFAAPSWSSVTKYKVAPGETINGIHWSPDGSEIAIASSDGSVLSVSATTGIVATAGKPAQKLSRMAWSRDRTAAACVGTSITAPWSLCDPRSGKEIAALEPVPGEVPLALEFDPSGQHLLGVANGDSSIFVWDVKRPKAGRRIEPPTMSAQHAAWSPDGTRIAAAHFDGVARIFDVKTGRLEKELESGFYSVDHVAWSADGKEILATTPWGAVAFDVATKAITRSFANSYRAPERLLCNDGATSIYGWESSYGLTRFDAATFEPIDLAFNGGKADVGGDSGGYTLVHGMGADDAHVAARLWRDGELEWFGASSSALKRVTLANFEPVWNPTLSRDGRTLAALVGTGRDRYVVLWAVADGKRLARIELDGEVLTGPVWSQDSATLAVFRDESATLIDAKSGKVSRELPFAGVTGPTAPTGAFSADNRQLVTGNGAKLRFFEVANGQMKRELDSVIRPQLWVGADHWVVDMSGKLLDAETGTTVVAQSLTPEHAGGCAGPGGRWVALPGRTLSIRRSDGAMMTVVRIAVGRSWETLAIASDGTFDGSEAAVAMVRVGDSGETRLTDEFTRRPDLARAFLAQ